jgi:hypothetical protein
MAETALTNSKRTAQAARGRNWIFLAAALSSWVQPAHVGAETLFDERPAFSMAEYPAKKWARCSEIRSMSEGLEEPEYRIDLSVFAELGLVTTDGTLWYLGVCGAPDEVKVLCVTYQPNGMRVAHKVYVKGVTNAQALTTFCLIHALPIGPPTTPVNEGV